MNRPSYLGIYDKEYFTGNQAHSGYDDYLRCEGVLTMWSDMLRVKLKPKSVLDIGAAYGYVVKYFRDLGCMAEGIEPSEWARSQAVVELYDSYLPNIPLPESQVFEVVVATEVMEHVPEEDTPASLQAMAARATKYVVCLIMLEDGETAHDDEGHINLHSRQWWEDQLDAVGLVRKPDLERWFNEHPYSEHMKWSGRLFVRGVAA